MTGLLLIGFFVVWIVLSFFIAKWAVRALKDGVPRDLVAFALFICLLPLPVADELVSKPAFDTLCDEHAKLKFDPEKIRGKTIFLADDPQPPIGIGLLRGYYIPSRYLDANTKELRVEARSYHIKGGLLMRVLAISETTAPLTMRSYCSPNEKPWQKTFLTRHDVKYVEEKEVK